MDEQHRHEQLKEQARQFWQKFKKTHPHLIPAELAKIVGVDSASISRWGQGRAISLDSVSKFIATDGLLETQEAIDLFELSLYQAGFSEKSFLHIANALARLRQVRETVEQPILVLSPLTEGNATFYIRIMRVLQTLAEKHNKTAEDGDKYHVNYIPIPDIRAKRKLREYYWNLDAIRGVVAITCHVEDSNWFEECQDAGIPLVLIHDNIDPEVLKQNDFGKVSAVWEGLKGLQDLVTHLAADHDDHHGCRDLRIVVGNLAGYHHRQRKVDCIIDEAAKYDIYIGEEHIYPIDHYNYVSGAVEAEAIITEDSGAEAIICLDDEVAHGAWETVKHYNADIKVSGYDNTAVARYSDITSINLRRGDRAKWAFDQILNGADKYPQIEWIDTKFERRGSCCHELGNRTDS